MTAHLALSYGLSQQTRELADAGYITLLIDAEADLAAYAQLRHHAPPPCVTGRAISILCGSSLTRAGSGLAQHLMTEVREAAWQAGGRTLWLSVWEWNPRAIAFYAKCGFRDVGAVDFLLGSDRQTDRVLVTELGSPHPAGRQSTSRSEA